MAKVAQYNFKTEAITIVTPVAETLFMCLAEVNEYTGQYGGKLIFTEDDLNKTVKYKVGKGKETKGVFKDIINGMIDDALDEYKDSGKKAVKANKIANHTDQDGNDTGKYELSCKNQDQPRIINKDRTVEKDFDVLVGNGSTMKAQLYLKPYVMQGKVGITAYLNTALLLDVIEYGGGNDMFDDDDFDDTSMDMGDDDTTDAEDY